MHIRLPTAQPFPVEDCSAAAGLGEQAERARGEGLISLETSTHCPLAAWTQSRASCRLPPTGSPSRKWLSDIRLKGLLPIPPDRESRCTEHRPAAHCGSSEKVYLVLNSWSAFSHGPARLSALGALFDLSSHTRLFIRRPALAPPFPSSRMSYRQNLPCITESSL